MYHFCRDEGGAPVLRDGAPCPRAGDIETYHGKTAICASGLHASGRAIDALKYSPGSWVRDVSLSGEIVEAADKSCARLRRTLAGPVDATNALRLFAGVVAARALTRYATAEARKAAMPAARLAVQWGLTGIRPDGIAAAVGAACAAWATAAKAAANAAASAVLVDATAAAARAAARAAVIAAGRAADADAAAAWAAERAWQDMILSKLLVRAMAARA